MKVAVFTLGCKVNSCESMSVIAEFISRGIEAVEGLKEADIYLINTCSVTGEADRKSRQAIARALKLNRRAKIYVCGCSSQRDYSEFTNKPNVRMIFGADNKSSIVQKILNDCNLSDHEPVCDVTEPSKQYDSMAMPFHAKTRSYIKIQDGCNNFCSYCIIPYLRGRSRSRSLDSIIQEASEAAKVTKEIVLTGINTSAYGWDIGESLCKLVKRMADIPVRKRFGSLECTVITPELLEAMAKSGFCDHFHLSLQSGSESVLKRMNRKYTPEFYSDKVNKIRSVFPDAGITTDIITGFCGETELEFMQTREFVQKIGFSDIHVFPYSERKGTAASKMQNIDKSERKARADILIKDAEDLRDKFILSRIGRVYEVYFEEKHGELCEGYTSNYIRVYSNSCEGELKKVKLTQKYLQGVKGEIYG